MTFAAWYAANVKPQLEETLKSMPVVAREALRTASRQAMASCWNAALDAVSAECGVWPEVSGGVNVNICRIGEIYLDKVLRA